MDHKKVIVGSIVLLLLIAAVISSLLYVYGSSLMESIMDLTTTTHTQTSKEDPTHFTIQGKIANKSPDVYQNPQAVCVFFETHIRRKMYTICTEIVDTYSFVLNLEKTLDSSAINQHGYGLGIITGGFNNSWANPPPKSPMNTGSHQEVAWANRYAIIYNNGTLSKDVSDCHWLRTFPEGFSCGRGAAGGCTGFEQFEPVDCREVILNVDNVQNLYWVKYT